MPNIKYADSSVQVNVMLEPSFKWKRPNCKINCVENDGFFCLQSLPCVDLAKVQDGMVLVLKFIMSANTCQQGL